MVIEQQLWRHRERVLACNLRHTNELSGSWMHMGDERLVRRQRDMLGI